MSASETAYTVKGMSCAHCAAAVHEEVARVAGVTAVDVDLASGRLRVGGSAERGAIAAAVDEAGYELATP